MLRNKMLRNKIGGKGPFRYKIEPLLNVEVTVPKETLRRMSEQAVHYINDYIAEADDRFFSCN